MAIIDPEHELGPFPNIDPKHELGPFSNIDPKHEIVLVQKAFTKDGKHRHKWRLAACFCGNCKRGY